MPSSDGKVVRLSIPPLTEERRKDLVKQVRKMAEECKVKQGMPVGMQRGIQELKKDK